MNFSYESHTHMVVQSKEQFLDNNCSLLDAILSLSITERIFHWSIFRFSVNNILKSVQPKETQNFSFQIAVDKVGLKLFVH